MSSEKEDIKTSKFLSLVLRHKPEEIGIELDKNGWTDVNILIRKMNQAGISITLDYLKHIVETNPKKRFSFNEACTRIRANQGHSVSVELGYVAQEPPEILFHGTGKKYVEAIFQQGLVKKNRHHVHLSADTETARKVGSRHGKPFIFEVLAGEMHRRGFEFFISDNGVWLTDHVPPDFLRMWINTVD